MSIEYAGVYLHIIKNSFQQCAVYKINNIIRLIASTIQLFVLVSVWSALFKGNEVIDGFTFSDMINYVIINMIVASLIRSKLGVNIANRINNGSIALDLLRPASFKLCLMADDIGGNLFQAVTAILPVCIAGSVMLGFSLPGQYIYFIFFLLSIFNGIVLCYTINFILGLLGFWFRTSFYVDWFLSAFFELFAGTFVPLWFYPSWLRTISNLLPFKLISFDPITIYLGKVSIAESLKIIVFQYVWIVGLLILEKIVWKKAQEKVIVHGG